MKMKKLMAFFAFISIIILTIPINCYSFLLGSERSAIAAKTDPFLAYYLSNYPNSCNSSLSSPYGSPCGIPPYGSPYGIPNNTPTGAIQNRAQPYGWNQPYNYGWNQPYNYGWNQPNYDTRYTLGNSFIPIPSPIYGNNESYWQWEIWNDNNNDDDDDDD